MSTKLKKLHEQVIVITGASSGIGLVTARMAAERGDHEGHVAESSLYTQASLHPYVTGATLAGAGLAAAALWHVTHHNGKHEGPLKRLQNWWTEE